MLVVHIVLGLSVPVGNGDYDSCPGEEGGVRVRGGGGVRGR
jgi:hypothetical protein